MDDVTSDFVMHPATAIVMMKKTTDTEDNSDLCDCINEKLDETDVSVKERTENPLIIVLCNVL